MNEDRTSLSQQEERVLLAIGNLGENAYGVTIRGTLVEAGTPTELAPLYVVLGRLEQRKLVKSWVGGATAERGGRAKKFYQLTAEGETALQVSEQSRQSLGSLRWGWTK